MDRANPLTQNIGIIADQLLADTRGYVSKDSMRFIYVVYEIKRFRTESDSNMFLRESGIRDNTTIVVLGGESADRKDTVLKKK
ncbi:hypothetical protein HOG48_03300 [Candidatus Peregrinibacteria bacterium]|mgnify:CR=1 FL=1|nr:hypothetical protein [Candidatus Peregrinibacteria bacterium]